MDLRRIRHDFPSLHRREGQRPLIYLDNAATTLKPQCVIDKLCEFYRDYSFNVHRSAHPLGERATQEYENARQLIADFIHAANSSQIIFTRGATDAINLVAASYGYTFLKPGDEIIISALEHHSNIVPWQMLCEQKGCLLKIIPMNNRGELLFESFQQLLSEKVKFIALTYVSNAIGTINPVDAYIAEAHHWNIPILIDAAQAVSNRPIDVQPLDCDFLVFSGHKMFGPTGIGILYAKQHLLEQMPPYQGGGDMIRSVSFAKTTYAPPPHKFEAGTPPIAGAIGLGQAVRYLQQFDWKDIGDHEFDLRNYTAEQLQKNEHLELIGMPKAQAGILSFIVKGVHAHDVVTIIAEEGIAVRAGHHCAQPIMDFFQVPATVRVSFSIYNTRDDIDALIKAIEHAQKLFNSP